MLLVWSVESGETISIKAGGFSGDHGKIDDKSTSVSVIGYVLTDEFPGGNDRRDKSGFPVHLKPDLLTGANRFTMVAPGTRPVWISVDIPPETPAGIYQGTVSRRSASGTVSHPITLDVLDKSLPPPPAWSFHLDLWQNPFAVARYHGVELWSKDPYYVACCIPKPNNFTFSPPAESCYEGWFAAAMGFDGFLRWAYNSWPENPEFDSRFTRWPSGDTYLVYPGARSSIRFERIREGIQDFEKIRILREELAGNPSAEAATGRKRLDDFLKAIDSNTLDKRSAADVVNKGKSLVCEIVKSVDRDQPGKAAGRSEDPSLKLMGNRFLTFSTLVRVRQIETSRGKAAGPDESSVHTPAEARIFRDAVEQGWPGARITWGFSWLALKDQRPNYLELKKLVVSYHEKYGDEITFVPGGYFANMYNTREQVNRDLHDGLRMVSEMVGGGYRPQCVIAGFLSADNLRFLAEKEDIHVCQGNIWSQYAVDNGDGEGSICYPYYPSREHFCKPAQGSGDLIDCVNLDGWTVDFLCARYAAPRMINGIRCGSRQGVGPIETLLRMGTEQGTKAMLATTAAHFDQGFELNGFAWVTSIWEMSLVEARKIYGYGGRNGMEGLVIWLSEIRRRWPEAKCITHGEFGMLWREQFKDNEKLDYRFVQRGSGIGGSDAEMEIRWFMNRDFRLALLRNWKTNTPEKVIDFTRYDLKASEPADPQPGQHSRNWSLLNRLNQKGVRPQDQPVSIRQLNTNEKALIKRRYPELIKQPPTSSMPMRTPNQPNPR